MAARGSDCWARHLPMPDLQSWVFDLGEAENVWLSSRCTERRGVMAVELRDFSVYPVWITGAAAHEYAKVRVEEGAIAVGRRVSIQRQGEATWRRATVAERPDGRGRPRVQWCGWNRDGWRREGGVMLKKTKRLTK